VATELLIRRDGDEGLFRAYDNLEFLAPVYAGDFIEARVGSPAKVTLRARWLLKPGRSSRHDLIYPIQPLKSWLNPCWSAEPVVLASPRRISNVWVDPSQKLPKERDMSAQKVIITAAISGAEVTQEMNPAVPYTIDQYVREAKLAHEAGAAIIHLHARYDDGTPTQDRERFREIIDAIQTACPDVIIQPSTGGATGMTAEERLQPTELNPEMASLDCGTMNFGGDDIFVNTENMIIAFAARMNERRN